MQLNKTFLSGIVLTIFLCCQNAMTSDTTTLECKSNVGINDHYDHYHFVWYVIKNRQGKSGFNCYPMFLSDFNSNDQVLAGTPDELVKWVRNHIPNGDKVVFGFDESRVRGLIDISSETGSIFRRVTREELNALNQNSTSKTTTTRDFDYGTTITRKDY